jgi:hypothetical protein
MKDIFIGLTATVIGLVIVFIGETIGHALFPLPPEIIPGSLDSLRANLHLVPHSALFSVIIAHAVAAFVAVGSAERFSTRTCVSYIVGGIFILVTLVNLLMLPHPRWFFYFDLSAVVIASLLGLLIPQKPQEPENDIVPA